VRIPMLLSFLTHQRWHAEIKGLTEFPRDTWPDNIPLLYYSYHVMAGLGSLFIALMALSSFLLYRGKLFEHRGVLWTLMLTFPLPFVANTMGWLTTELGRQPWLVHGVLRTKDGSSTNVSSGSTLFSLLGFMGLYAMLSLLFFLLVSRIVQRGPMAGASVMAELWFWLLAGMLAVYAVLDGFDFGVGMLHFVVAKTPAERDTLLRSIGPVWDGNEVWLVAAGGTLFGAFPALYAAAFSGFYLPLMIVLWLLLFRALGIELRHHFESPLWQQFWDVAFSGASALLALFFGAALGNLVRGLPLNEHGEFFEPLWTDFRVGDVTGILDWYTLLVGVTATAALALHGALWLGLKTDAALGERADGLARRLWPLVALLTLATTLASGAVQPRLLDNLKRFPLGGLLPLLAGAGLVGIRVFVRRAPARAFMASCTLIVGLILSAAFAIFPHALTARLPGRELTVAAAASQPSTLAGMLVWWLPGLALAVGYSYFIYARMPKKFTPGGSEH